MSSSLSVLGPAADAISSTLVSGTPLRAIGGMWAISSLVIVPLTFIRQGYSFSVGYGFSVAAMVSTLFCVLVSCNRDGESPHVCLLLGFTFGEGMITGCAGFLSMNFPISFVILILL